MTIERAAIFISALFAGHVLYAAPTERSVSPSRQFIIYGADAALRGAVSDLAERTKADFLVLLRQRDNWTVPIVVNLQLQQANLPEIPPADFRFSQTGFGLKLQLDLTLSEKLDASLIERELLGAIADTCSTRLLRRIKPCRSRRFSVNGRDFSIRRAACFTARILLHLCRCSSMGGTALAAWRSTLVIYLTP